MGAWLLKITGVIALSTLSSLLIPNGQTKKYVKGIFALITLFVLVSPLPKLLKSDFSGFPNAFDTVSELEIDETFCTAWRRTHIKRRKGISKSF